VNLQQANIKYNSDSTEDLDFEISTKESSFVLEAANHVDLRQWIRAINNTRLRPAGEPEQPLEKSGVLYYQEKSERRGRLYWFVLKDDQMQYFDQATKEEVHNTTQHYPRERERERERARIESLIEFCWVINVG